MLRYSMDQFLAAAKQFEQETRRIRLYDLGVALLLEYFSLPILWMTNYARIKDRLVQRQAAEEIHELTRIAPPFIRDGLHDGLHNGRKATSLGAQYPECAEALTLIGQGLRKRYNRMVFANRLSRTLAVLVPLFYVMIGAAIVCAASITQLWIVSGVWLLALGSATVVCMKNLHWRTHAGFRGSTR